MSLPTRIILSSLGVLFLLACEMIVPLDEFDFDYEPQIKIEADLFPKNLGKSVLRIDRTFTIADTISMDRAHLRNAEARLLHGPDTLATFAWSDSASSYIYLDLEEFDPEIIFNPDSIVNYQDTLSYGGYKFGAVDFELEDFEEYTLQVEIDDAVFSTSFRPYPAIEVLNVIADSVAHCSCGVGTGVGIFDVVHKTMTTDTARIVWAEDPSATFYTVYFRKLDSVPPSLPQVYSFPGPVLSLQGIEPGEYEIIVGTMNDTWYRHYSLNDFPPNHEARNFFSDEALGFAGTLNERYFRIRLIPPVR